MFNDRYKCHIALGNIGIDGQSKIENSHVLIVGAGGLGCPLIQYLAGAGIGKITVIDNDYVEAGNLHRQTLYNENDIGKQKALVIKDRIHYMNSNVIVNSIMEKLDPVNAIALVENMDVVVDCADNFATTYTLSDICMEFNKPFVTASAIGFNGYVGSFCANGSPSIRAVFPELPQNAGSCSNDGVFGPLLGVIGSMQASMVIAIITGFNSTIGYMTTVDLLKNRFATFCLDNAIEPKYYNKFIALNEINSTDVVIDLVIDRNLCANCINCSISDINESFAKTLDENRRIVVCCRTGLRAWNAANRLREFNNNLHIVLLAAD